ncbi:MAG: phosphate ABC transporter permease subunit PstC [Deltaproteobacteria bacterium]|jgi:phosphate transport system permease protein|nr:phosphate ABC transporter permease subunit PstC [Deltaproteobacteria bacterium]
MRAKKAANFFFFLLTCLGAGSLVFLTAGILVTLVVESQPGMERFGFIQFILSRDWNYAQEAFGALRPLTGTILAAVFAVILATPVAIGVAVFLTELCPAKIKGAIALAIELLAAIPSVIYGLWGLFVLAPFLEKYFQPIVGKIFGGLPWIGPYFQTQMAGGLNLVTAAMVLGVMILPFIASLAREGFAQVPEALKESAYGLGATCWETIVAVVWPTSQKAVLGGIIMASGRALGETMAVAYVIGNRHGALESLFSPYVTITSVIANEFNEAGPIQMSALFYLTLALFLANLIVLTVAKRLMRKS